MIGIARLKVVYANLRIRHKTFLLIAGLMTLFGASSAAVYQYAFAAYDEELYRQAAKSLQLSSSGIESELLKMERLLFRISTDPQVQTHLRSVAGNSSGYERYVAIDKIQELLPTLGSLDKYVLSLQLFDNWQDEYAAGVHVVRTSEERLRQIVDESAIERGQVRWFKPTTADSALLVARQIRSIASDNFLTPLGTIAIRIDMKAMLADYTRSLNANNGAFVIADEETVLYPEQTEITHSDLGDLLQVNGQYQTALIGDDRYFVTSTSSRYMDWSYVVLTPYEEIFQAVSTVRKTVLIVYAALAALALMAAIRFSMGITKPIDLLIAKMKRVQFGQFDHGEEDEEMAKRKDESGQLHRSFRIMISRIDELINENYLKQLMLKETKLKALQAQINPHFLYNTLDSISWLAKAEGQRQIAEMVQSLGVLLHNSMNHQSPLVTLGEECETIRNYIVIQHIRFEERLCFRMEVPEELQGLLLPKLSLQPLIENAIHYGMETMLETCRIVLRAQIEEGALVIRVLDNGPGLPEDTVEHLRCGELQARGSGIGLRNIDDRIKLMFGEPWGVRIEYRNVGACVALLLPPRREGDEEHVQRVVGG